MILLISSSQIAGITGACYHAQLLVRMESCELLPKADFEPGAPDLSLSNSYDYRLKPLNPAWKGPF
jgi:hypothetical protein